MPEVNPNKPNIKPNFKPVEPPKPYRALWVQKVLPLVFDDALSYYEALAKVKDYVNKLLEDVKTLDENVDNLHDDFLKLQTWINEELNRFELEMNNQWVTFQQNMKADFEQYKNETTEYLNQQFNNFVNDANTRINQFLADLEAKIDAYFDAYKKEVNERITNFENSVNTEISNFKSEMNEWKTQFINDFESWKTEYQEYIQNIIDSFKSDVQTQINKFKSDITNAWNTWKEEFITENNQWREETVNNLTQMFNTYKTEVQEIIDNFKSDITTSFNDYKTEIQQIIDNFKNEITEDITNLTQQIQQINQSISNIENNYTNIDKRVTNIENREENAPYEFFQRSITFIGNNTTKNCYSTIVLDVLAYPSTDQSVINTIGSITMQRDSNAPDVAETEHFFQRFHATDTENIKAFIEIVSFLKKYTPTLQANTMRINIVPRFSYVNGHPSSNVPIVCTCYVDLTGLNLDNPEANTEVKGIVYVMNNGKLGYITTQTQLAAFGLSNEAAVLGYDRTGYLWTL